MTRAFVIFAALFACACSARNLSWYYTLAPDVTGAVWIEASVHEGACDGAILHEQGFAPGSSAMTPPSLDAGEHSFVVHALDASCNVIGVGCARVDLPLDDGASVTVEVTTVAPFYACAEGETCIAGRCEGPNTPDGGMSDGGACASGCWSGGECVDGTAIEACGTGGGLCETCCTRGDTCESGRCVPEIQVTSVTAGDGHTCAVTEGVLRCWGLNSIGQVAEPCCDGAGRMSTLPVDARSDWTSVSASFHTNCGLRGTAMMCWGANNYGQQGLGDGAPENPDEPMTPMGPAAWRHVAPGIWHTVGIDDAGELYCWGGTVHHACASTGADEVNIPTQVGLETDWEDACAGFYHTCGVRGGEIHCWGWNQDGETGSGSEGGTTETPTRVGDATDWAEVTCGYGHTCGRRTDGRVFCWGCGGADCFTGTEEDCGGDCSGKLGTGVAANASEPFQVTGDLRATAIDAGAHTCAVAMDGSLYCWGPNLHGQLGVGDTERRTEPTRLAMEGWTEVSAGATHTCAIRDTGALYCWGLNATRQLGTGGSTDPTMPTLVPTRVCMD